MKKWTESDIKKLNLKTNLHALPKKNTVLAANDIKVEKKSIEKETIKTLLWVLHREGTIPDYIEELEFHPTRNFRFDWAIPEWMVAVEYEGLMSKKSGHTTVKGYTKDCDKYNSAQLLGWTVLRYTALNYEQLGSDLKLLSKK